MFSSPLLSPQRDELSLPATSKALLTSLLISIISTYRSHIRRPFDGTIRRASLEYVLVPTAVSTTRRAPLPATSKALLTSLLISIISTYRSHIRRPFDGTIRRACLEYVLVPTAVSTTRRALSLPATSKALSTSLLISIISTYRSHIRRPFDGTIRRLYIGHTFAASE